MELPPAYQPIMQRRAAACPSVMSALLPAHGPPPEPDEVQPLLEAAGLRIQQMQHATPEPADRHWQLEARVLFRDRAEPMALTVWLGPAELPETLDMNPTLTPLERQAAWQSVWSLGTAVPFGRPPAADLQRQAQILNTLAPEAVVVLDASARTERSPRWLREAAAAATPPEPTALYAIHVVPEGPRRTTDDWWHVVNCICAVGVLKEPPPDLKERIWLHTHGLQRCGLPEIEVLAVPREAVDAMGQLIATAATRSLGEGIPSPAEPFTLPEGLDVVWLPWEEAVRRAPRGVPGAREYRDDEHGAPSAVLFTPPGRVLRRYRSPVGYAPRVDGSPVALHWTPTAECMVRHAWQSFDLFRAFQQSFGARGQWAFFVELGYDPGGPGGPRTEHLWFEVNTLAEDTVDATLLGSPESVEYLTAGQRNTHSLQRLAQWAISCPHGRFGPDSVGQLERRLADDGARR